MDLERQKSFIFRFIYWLIVAGIVFALLKYVMPLVMPFIIGFLVSLALRPLSEWISKICKTSPKWTAIIVLIFIYSIIVAALILSGVRIAAMIGHFFLNIPDYYRASLEPTVMETLEVLELFFSDIDPSVQSTLDILTGNVISTLTNLVTSSSTAALNWLRGFVGALPLFIVNFVFAVISSFYVSADYPGIKSFVLKQIRPKLLELLVLVKENAISAAGNYGKAYLILLTVMFVEMLIGMTWIGVSNAPIIAFGIAIWDIIPVLGTGGILLPWAAIDFITGRTVRALQLVVLYGVVSVIRNAIEPKVIGSQIGLHPLVTLLCMYVGASLFGVVGLFGLPIAVTIIRNLDEKGVIKIFVH